MGLKHGQHIKREKGHTCDIFLTQIQAMGIETNSFSESEGTIKELY